MTAQFTRGPWMVMPEEVEKLYFRVRGTRLGERFKIANAPFPIADESEKQEALANARLIAAAPELYEALAAYVAHIEPPLTSAVDAGYDNTPHVRLMDTAKAALAKARGDTA